MTQMNIDFERTYAFLMKSEGGFTNDQRDRGNHLPDGRPGCTNCGVTQAAWEAWVGHQVTEADMRALTPAIVKPFYHSEYWNTSRGDDLPVGVDYLVFDFGVNSGARHARMLLQQVVGTTVDGAIGQVTLAAVTAMPVRRLIDAYSEAKREFYKSLHDPVHEQGWLNRVDEVRLNAMSMVG